MTTKRQKTYEPIIDLQGEVWKDIPNYEGLYQVSNKGRVKSIFYNSNKRQTLLKHYVYNRYHRVYLCKDKMKKQFFVHRLVYDAFVGNLPKFKHGKGDEMLVINHKDENPSNNCIENLELITHTENVNYGTGLQRLSKYRTIPVYQYSIDGEFIKKWEYAKELKENGFKTDKIRRCCVGKRKTHKGYIWSYKPIENK